MKKIIASCSIILFCMGGHAQTHNVFNIGHSLLGHTMPSMLKSMCDSTAGVNHTYNVGVLIGAPLHLQWTDTANCMGYQGSTINSAAQLRSGNYDVFTMIEGSNWDATIPWFHKYTDSFHTRALEGNPNIQTYLYEGWNCLSTGTPAGCPWDNSDSLTWRPRVRNDLATWESVMDSLNYKHPTANPVLIIPSAQGLANLMDSIASNSVPGLTNVNDIFSDNIHPNDTGFYFLALVHYACIYKRSPVGLPTITYNEYGGLLGAPPVAMALKMQQIAWETVCNYQYSGVNCNVPLGINVASGQRESKGKTGDNEIIHIFPNPTQYRINIESSIPVYQVDVLNVYNQPVIKKGMDAQTINLGSLPAGCYFVRVLTEDGLYTRRVIKQD